MAAPARAEKIAKDVAEVAGATAHKIAKFKTAEDIFGRPAFAHASVTGEVIIPAFFRIA